GFSGDASDLDRAVFDLRHLQLEQPLDKTRMRAGKEHLRSLGGFLYIHDVNLEPVVDLVSFARHLFVDRQDAFRAAEVDEDRAVAESLYRAGDNLALSFDVVVEDHASFGFSDPL